MTPENCKKLLEMGILQAYAEGKEIEIYHRNNWTKWEDGYNFVASPENYRIKPEPTFEVGDLVLESNLPEYWDKVPNGCIYKITQVHPDSCEVKSITDGFHNIVHKNNLTKVREVRTPFTFEEAVKACAEHGFKIRHNNFENTITEIDYESIRLGDSYLYYHKECLQTVFTSDNTPFCNISYEPITN
jgi:hypothetical protein